MSDTSIFIQQLVLFYVTVFGIIVILVSEKKKKKKHVLVTLLCLKCKLLNISWMSEYHLFIIFIYTFCLYGNNSLGPVKFLKIMWFTRRVTNDFISLLKGPHKTMKYPQSAWQTYWWSGQMIQFWLLLYQSHTSMYWNGMLFVFYSCKLLTCQCN